MTKKSSNIILRTPLLLLAGIITGCFAPPTRPTLPPWQRGVTLEGTYGLNDNRISSDSVNRGFLPSYALSARISKNILGHIADIGIANDGAFTSISFYRTDNIEYIGIGKVGFQLGLPFQMLHTNTAATGYGRFMARTRFCKQACMDFASGVYYEEKFHEYSNDKFSVLDSSEIQVPYLRDYSVRGYDMGIPFQATLTYKSKFVSLAYHHSIQSKYTIKWQKVTSIEYQNKGNEEVLSKFTGKANWLKNTPIQLSLGFTF